MRVPLGTFILAVLVLLAQDCLAQTILQLEWEYPTPKQYPQAIVSDQKGRPYLHVALKNGGLAILEASDPRKPPRECANLGIERFGGLEVMNLTQQQDVLFLALGNFFDARGSQAGLAAVSVKQPRTPKVLALWKSTDTLHGSAAVLVHGTTAYLGAINHGVLIFDVADPSNFRMLGSIVPDVNFPLKNPGKVQHPNARGLAFKDDLLYVAYDAGGLRVINVKNPRLPREVGRYINMGMGKKQQAYNNLVIDGTTALIAVDYAGLEIVDIRDPRQITQVAWWNPWQAHTLGNLWFNSPGHTNQLEYDAARRLVYLSAGDADLQVVDVSDRTRPRLSAAFGATKDKLGVWGLSITPEHVYLAYIPAFVPFRGTWAGIKTVKR